MLKIKLNFVWIFVILASTFWFINAFAKNTKKPNHSLELSISLSQDSYILGEPVSLTAKVTNKSDEDVTINKILTLESGHLQVLIAEDDGVFGSYLGPGWGIDERIIQFDLKSGESITDSANILWNLAPKTSHLNKDAAKKAIKGRIPTFYAFNKKGVFRIKVRMVLNGKSYESNEITIVIEEPTGDDREIWKVIKNRPELAYFIQKGDTKTYEEIERIKFSKELENLLLNYPNGKISKVINKSLEINKERSKKQKNLSN